MCVAENGKRQQGSTSGRGSDGGGSVRATVQVCQPLSLADCLSGPFFWTVMVVVITAEFCLARSVLSRL